jgi:hypothetical protein
MIKNRLRQIAMKMVEQVIKSNLIEYLNLYYLQQKEIWYCRIDRSGKLAKLSKENKDFQNKTHEI